MMSSPVWKPYVLARASTMPAPVAFLGGSLRYFSADAQSETCRRAGFVRERSWNSIAGARCRAADCSGAATVSAWWRQRPARSRIASVNGNSSTISPSSSVTSMIAFSSAPLGAFGLQQFPDHGARDFPGAIGIAQLFAFGIGDQLIADPGVEEIARHGSKSTSVRAPESGAGDLSQVLYRELRPRSTDPDVAFALQATAEALIRAVFDADARTNSVNYFAMQHKRAEV